jgi:chloramphenicol 3-O phosphotransferase
VLDGWARSLRELALAGNELIAETIIMPETARLYKDLFGAFTVYFIGIRCPLKVAQEREARRSDRIDRMELDSPEFYAVHAHSGYDLEIDSSVLSPEVAADRIGDLLGSQPNPSAFGRLAH